MLNYFSDNRTERVVLTIWSN